MVVSKTNNQYNEKIKMMQELERKRAEERAETVQRVLEMLRKGALSIEEAEKQLGIDPEELEEREKILLSKKSNTGGSSNIIK